MLIHGKGVFALIEFCLVLIVNFNKRIFVLSNKEISSEISQRVTKCTIFYLNGAKTVLVCNLSTNFY